MEELLRTDCKKAWKKSAKNFNRLYVNKYLLTVAFLLFTIFTFSQTLNYDYFYGKWVTSNIKGSKAQVWNITKDSIVITVSNHKEIRCTWTASSGLGDDNMLLFPVDSPFVFKYRVDHLDKNVLKIKKISYRTIDKNRNLSPAKTDIKNENVNFDFIRQKS
jgi:hypothetical protein